MTASLIRSPGRSGAFSEVQAPIAAIRAPLDGLLTRSGLSIALASSLVLILAALLLRPLIPIDETRYMTVAWEMYDTGNWLVPHLNGAPYSHKPPMLFWLIGAVWTITGSSSAFAARLAPALFVPLTIFLTFVLGRKIATRQEASIASLILAGFTAFCLYGSLVMFDAMLAAATLLALIGLVDAAGTAPRKGFALFAAGIGCGLLVKGPVIFIHVLPAALLAPLWLQRPRRWSRWYVSVLAAIGLGVGIGLLWALPAAQSGGAAYADMILWGQTAGRVVNSFDHARPFWFYIAICPLLLFPWILSANVWAAMRRFGRSGASERMRRLPPVVAIGSFGLFSLVSGKQIHYLIPVLPLVSLILAQALAQARTVRPVEPGFAVFLFLAGLAVLGLALFPLPHIGIDPWIGVLLLAMAALAWLLRRHLFAAAMFTTCGFFLALHLGGFLGGFDAFDLDWLGRQLRAHPNAPVAYIGSYKGQLGFIGRLAAPVAVIDHARAQAWMQTNPGGVLIASQQDISGLMPAPSETRPYREGRISLWLPQE